MVDVNEVGGGIDIGVGFRHQRCPRATQDLRVTGVGDREAGNWKRVAISAPVVPPPPTKRTGWVCPRAGRYLICEDWPSLERVVIMPKAFPPEFVTRSSESGCR